MDRLKKKRLSACYAAGGVEGGPLKRWAFGLWISRQQVLMLSCGCCCCIISIPVIF